MTRVLRALVALWRRVTAELTVNVTVHVHPSEVDSGVIAEHVTREVERSMQCGRPHALGRRR